MQQKTGTTSYAMSATVTISLSIKNIKLSNLLSCVINGLRKSG